MERSHAGVEVPLSSRAFDRGSCDENLSEYNVQHLSRPAVILYHLGSDDYRTPDKQLSINVVVHEVDHVAP